ncbi:MAG: glycosyltransferase [Opitutaceae bacterium]
MAKATAKVPFLFHVVVDGPWGTTRAAESLVRGHLHAGRMAAMLVLRRSRSTTDSRLDLLTHEGLPARLLPYKPNLWMMWRLRQLCRDQRPDVLFAHGYSLHLWARFAALAAGVPRIVHVEHNWENYPVHRLWQNRWLARRTDRVVCVAQGIAGHLRSLGLPPDKLAVIPNGLDLSPFSAAGRPAAARGQDLIMPARFSPQKDHATLLRALARLAREGCRPTLALAGDGNPRRQAAHAAAAESLGIARQVAFLGLRQDVPELLMQTKIMVLSSHYEGMPLAVLEGMAAGCAVVASNIPGVREVVDHDRTGLLFPPGDEAALAAALKSLLHRPDRVQRLGAAAAHQIAQHHSLTAMVGRYETLAGQLLNHDPRHSLHPLRRPVRAGRPPLTCPR